MIRKSVALFILLTCLRALQVGAQNAAYHHQKFCTTLNKVFESGRVENFESLVGMNSKQSPFLQVPGPNVKLEPFPVLYIDKDNRFVGKTNENFDSLSAIKKLEELKDYISVCLDSTQWFWVDFKGDDSTTVFFTEDYVWQAISRELTLTLASVKVSEKVYTANLYIRRNKK
ncbi:MAG: hypothetical protein KIS94_01505 [Chitinophagales bacterium]|nr:hypothetical protein [Chitinophagales bacterium]